MKNFIDTILPGKPRSFSFDNIVFLSSKEPDELYLSLIDTIKGEYASKQYIAPSKLVKGLHSKFQYSAPTEKGISILANNQRRTIGRHKMCLLETVCDIELDNDDPTKADETVLHYANHVCMKYAKKCKLWTNEIKTKASRARRSGDHGYIGDLSFYIYAGPVWLVIYTRHNKHTGKPVLRVEIRLYKAKTIRKHLAKFKIKSINSLYMAGPEAIFRHITDARAELFEINHAAWAENIRRRRFGREHKNMKNEGEFGNRIRQQAYLDVSCSLPSWDTLKTCGFDLLRLNDCAQAFLLNYPERKKGTGENATYYREDARRRFLRPWPPVIK